MVECYDGMLTLNGNLLASVDVETTGLVDGYHEIIQIAVQPLDSHFEPYPGILPFYMNLQPEYPTRIDPAVKRVHHLDMADLHLTAFDKYRVADMLDEWFQRLNLPFQRKLVPLAHNWIFDSAFIKAWLGLETFNQLFHFHPRDTMLLALSINDRAVLRGADIPFNRFGLKDLCRRLNIGLDNAHDALADALAVAKLYRELLYIDI
jgi:DNA polymerase III epsilon subunit-like protein